MTSSTQTLDDLAAALASGAASARALTEACLEAIGAGQGHAAFMHVDAEGARAAADAHDALRAAGAAPSRFAGIPISVKDLFDVQGQVTRAGSIVHQARAEADAPAVARLRRAGFVLIGRNTMTEFAFSGLGLNPHYGTPLSPWRRSEGRICGGSSSGGAAAVADGMAHAALGTDTGGSCRIPAAWCGLVGFKPTASRVPREGAVPLSTTLDSVGPIVRSVACAAALDALLAGEQAQALRPVALRGLRLACVFNIVLDDIEPDVAAAYEHARAILAGAGAQVNDVHLAPLDQIPRLNSKGGFAAAESYAWHRQLLAAREADYDPRVAVRIKRGAEQSGADYVDLIAARAKLIADMEEAAAGFDALLMPTTPIVPPRLSDLSDDAAYGRINLLALRNPALINFIDGCAISIPIHAEGDAPAGLMIAGLRGCDHQVLAIAQAIEQALTLRGRH